ncbi:MAG TPA: NADH-quinone oxidoreductase subunit A [Myxococcota bacterium]|nr:NADH-quinone oxidoreductase subunit A [Myxococcota bacterium]
MSLAIYILGVFAVVAVMLSSYFLGERGKNHGRDRPYESGIKSYGSTRLKFFTQYFLLAILFVIFDLESVFLYLWSSAIRAVGWPGFLQMSFFIGMLLLALLYAFRAGVLNLLPRSSKKRWL